MPERHRILTTHAGSLPRPDRLRALYVRRNAGETVDPDELSAATGEALAAVIAGTGGPMFFIPLITRTQTVFEGADIARVWRLRLAIMAGSRLLASLVATWLFEVLGATTTVLGCGLLILLAGIAGHVGFSRLERRLAMTPATLTAASAD